MNISIIRNPGVFILLLLLSASSFLTGCTDESTEINSAAPLEQITEATQQEFVRQMVTEYLVLSDQLLARYQGFKGAEDAHGFILFRNKTWTPDYMAAKTRYQELLHKQKAYIYRNQLDGLFDRFMNLQKLALHLKHSLQDQDWPLEQQAIERLSLDKSDVLGYLKVARR